MNAERQKVEKNVGRPLVQPQTSVIHDDDDDVSGDGSGDGWGWVKGRRRRREVDRCSLAGDFVSVGRVEDLAP